MSDPDSHDDRPTSRSATRRTGSAPDWAPERVGRYVIDGSLGRGGMGVVHRAFDERLHRHVALKTLPFALTADPYERAQLEREARAVARINHPNVGAIYGLEEEGAALYLVLELVPGQTLRALLAAGPVPQADALRLCAQVATGLEAVHRTGMLHRDLKPSNVMVTPDGVVKLLDFGLAFVPRAGASKRDQEPVGTPGYMSPEQVRGEALDARSDAWAWGCVLYEALTGAPAFGGPSAHECKIGTLTLEPDWSRLPETLPDGVTALLRSCLSKDCGERPGGLEELRRRLESAVDLASSGARRAPRSLPAEHDTFVGRDGEMAMLERKLLGDGVRCLSVLGLGGTGKTRLCLRFAWETVQRWPGGAWFCDLSEARNADGIVEAVATALDVRLGREDPVVQLSAVIAGRGRSLIVLDNFEQVARHAQETLGRWLARCPEASFLVTTREVLGVAGEEVLALQPLSKSDAVSLFETRALAARRGTAPAASEHAEIEELVDALDRLPLAIELAAARVRVITVEQVRARLSERFKLLSGAGARRDRQATLRATLDWSWSLLNEWERAALAQLSVFEGGFTLASAEAVLDLSEWPDAPWPMDLVQALLDKSLLFRSEIERFDLLVSVQEYAAERLSAAGGASARTATERRHGLHFASFGSDEALERLEVHGGTALRRAMARELDNLVVACRRAVARGDGEIAVPTCRASWSLLLQRGPIAKARDLAESVLSLSGLGTGERIRAACTAARVRHALSEDSPAREAYELALALARESGDRRWETIVFSSLGTLHRGRGRADEALACYDEARALARALGERRLEGNVLADSGLLHLERGRLDEAAACYDEALALSRAVGARITESGALGGLAAVHQDGGRFAEARASYDAALAIAHEIGDRRHEGILVGNLGNLAREGGSADDAEPLYSRALVIHREVGDRRQEAVVLGNLAQLRQEKGRSDEAKALYEESLAISRELGNRAHQGFLLGCLGLLHADRFDAAAASACYDEALAIARAVKRRRAEGALFLQLGRLHEQCGRLIEARASFDTALTIARETASATDEGAAMGRLGKLLARQGESVRALQLVRDGEALARGGGVGVQLGEVLCDRAEVEHAIGDPVAARSALDEAERLAAELRVLPAAPLSRAITRARAGIGPG